MFFLGGGKCPNLGVVNVRILGVVNVLLANDSQSFESYRILYNFLCQNVDKTDVNQIYGEYYFSSNNERVYSISEVVLDF